MTATESRETLRDLAQRIEALGRYLDLPTLRHELDRLGDLTSREGFWDDQQGAQKVLRDRATIEDKVNKFDSLDKELRELSELLDMAAAEGDEDLVEEVGAQVPSLAKRTRDLETERMLSGPEDGSDAIVSIHPGAGGTEAQDWAEILMRMYLRWAERRGYTTEMIDHAPGDEAGIKDASFIVKGPYAYGFLRAEGGVHRLIRISPYDASARRHTSFAAVYVVPDLPEDDDTIEIKPEDLKVDTYRASGAGGQHVNRTESAIRITHLPSGIIVQCQSERSQHKNRSTAMKMLRGHLYEKQRREREEAFEEHYGSDRQDIAFGSQVRTYTLHPYLMVKDERTDHKVSNANAVLDGDLDEFIEVYLLAASDRRAKTKEEGKAT
ncbi:MAG: peptide chain release factor 2 [Myxococcales bacterium]|nr:peptide chain release factor 2 [Myxococcales bacterium]